MHPQSFVELCRSVIEFLFDLLCDLWMLVTGPSITIPGVPVLRGDSLLGYSAALLAKDGKSHEINLNLAESFQELVQFNFLGQHIVMVNDPVLARQALMGAKGKGFFHNRDRRNPPSIFGLTTGPEWLLRRNTFKHALTQRALRNFQGVMKTLVDEMCDKLDKICATKDDTPVLIDEVFGEMTVDVICHVGFQFDISQHKDPKIFAVIHEHLRVLFESNLAGISNLAAFSLGNYAEITKARGALRSFMRDILAHLKTLKHAGSLHPDSLGRAIMDLAAFDGISEENVLSEISIFFIAGHETTAHTLSWLVYSLAKNPEVQRKVGEAVDEWALNKAAREQESQDNQNHYLPPYLEAVVKESMRRYPAVSSGSLRQVTQPQGLILELGRDKPGPYASAFLKASNGRPHGSNSIGASEDCKECTVDDDIDVRGQSPMQERTIVVPCQSWVYVNTFGLHNSRVNWGPDALEFKPERWMDATRPLQEDVPSAGKDVATAVTPFNIEAEEDPLVTSVCDTDKTTSSVPASFSSPESPMSSPAVTQSVDIVTTDPATTITANATDIEDAPEKTTSPPPSARNPLSSPSIFAGGPLGHLQFAPFSFGPRNCIGMNLALLEIRMTALQLAGRFTFRLWDEDMRDEHKALETFLTLRPKDKLPVLVRKRKVKDE